MRASKHKVQRRMRRRRGARKRLRGTAERPRLVVFRSLKHVYAQIIDDDRGVTLCAASSKSKDLRGQLKGGGNVDAARAVGAALAVVAKKNDIGAVCFDRGGFKYHGRVKGLADAAREGGLVF